MPSDPSENAVHVIMAELAAPRVFQEGLSPNEIADLLRDAGFRAKLEERGDSLVIRSGGAGCNFSVYFYESLKGPDDKAASFQLSAGFDVDPGQEARMARICEAFNVEWRYAKAYLRTPALAYVDLDWYVKGCTEANIRYAITTWDRFLGDFARRLRDEPKENPIVLN